MLSLALTNILGICSTSVEFIYHQLCLWGFTVKSFRHGRQLGALSVVYQGETEYWPLEIIWTRIEGV